MMELTRRKFIKLGAAAPALAVPTIGLAKPSDVPVVPDMSSEEFLKYYSEIYMDILLGLDAYLYVDSRGRHPRSPADGQKPRKVLREYTPEIKTKIHEIRSMIDSLNNILKETIPEFARNEDGSVVYI